jgi:Ser/Thr protein kinase RdoA (MazF antagonist)
MAEFGALRENFIPYLQNEIMMHYDLRTIESICCISYSENITYAAYDGAGGKVAIICVNKPGYHRPKELLGEVVWMDEIRRKTDVHIPQVYTDMQGTAVRHFTFPGNSQIYYYIVSEYVEGEELEHLAGPIDSSMAVRVGEIAAKLHVQSFLRSREKPDLDCFQWDVENLLGHRARWGDFNLYPAADASRQLLNTAAQRIIRKLKTYGKSRDTYFLIHSDLHTGNLLVNGNDVTVIDFDDCGYGWFLYDLAAFLSHQNDHLDELVNGWCTGYETVRALTDEDIQMIPVFVLLRRLVRLGWLSTRKGNDVVSHVGDDYFEVTLALAEQYLSGAVHH